MRIVHALGTLHPSAGGPPAVALHLAATQVALGHDVLVLCPDREVNSGDIAALVRDIVGDLPVEVQGGLRVWPFSGLAALPLPAAVAGRLAQSHWLHLHALWEPIVPALASWAKRYQVPYSITPHGVLDPWSLSQRGVKKRLALALGYRRALEQAQFIQCLTESEQRSVRDLGLSRTRVIPNGVAVTAATSSEQRSFLTRFPILAGRVVLLYLGRLHPKKGLERLLDAFVALAPRYPEPMLVLAGPDGGSEAELRQRVQAAGLQERVVFTGALGGGDKRAALASAYALCLTSYQEGLSMSLLEAMASGIPAVLTRECDFGGLFEGNLARVVEGTADGLAAALAALIDDPVAATALGQRGRHWAEQHYTWGSVATRLLDAYTAERSTRAEGR